MNLGSEGKGRSGRGAVEEEGEGEATGSEGGANHEEVEAEGGERSGGERGLGKKSDSIVE